MRGEVRSPKVSVVVPVRNAAGTIERCLHSVLSQDYPRLELIVVDNYSEDGTWQMVTELAHRALRGGPERSAQRNLATPHASGEYILWIDADMELGPDVVRRAVEAAQQAEAAGVFIPEVTVGEGFWTSCRALERACYQGRVRVESPRLVTRDYLVRTGGFNEELSGTEDAELRERLLADRSVLARAEATIYHHESGLTLRDIVRKRYYYGAGLPAYRRAHPGAMAAQMVATARALLSNWRRLAAHPLLAAGIVVMRCAEATAYAAGGLRGVFRPPG